MNGKELLKDLVLKFSQCWNPKSKKFENLPFDEKSFLENIKHASEYGKTRYPKLPPTEPVFGYVCSIEVEHCKIFVEADLHGSLKTLLDDFKVLDDEVKHYVFLGDFVDRGEYGLHVLWFLTVLKNSYPKHVHLMRGNHEDININEKYGDSQLKEFLANEDNEKILSTFYFTMPLGLAISEKSQTAPCREYVLFVHGLVELDTDLVELFDQEKIDDYSSIWITYNRKNTLSSRQMEFLVEKNDENNNKQILHTSTSRVLELVKKQKTQSFCGFMWGNIAGVETKNAMGLPCPQTCVTASFASRGWRLSPQDVKHWMRVNSSEMKKIKFIVRGHQHKFMHYFCLDGDDKGKEKEGEKEEEEEEEGENTIIVTTLPIGMSGNIDHLKNMNFQLVGNKDRAYIFTTAPKVKDWGKQAILRDTDIIDENEEDSTTIITDPVTIGNKNL